MKRLRPLLALSLLSVSALAQPRDPVAAEALFRQGREALKGGKIEEGCAWLAESHRLDPTPGALLSVADCAERLGKLATARQHFLDLLGQLPASDPRRTIADKRARELEPRVPRVTLRLTSDAPADARVLRDGTPLGAAALGVPLPVDPGKHTFEVRAPGRLTTRLELSFAERESREVILALGPPEPAAAPPPTPSAASSSASSSAASTWSTASALPSPGVPPSSAPEKRAGPQRSDAAGWLLLGGGSLAIAGSLYAGLLVLDRKATVEAHCRNRICDDEGLEAGRSGRMLSGLSTAAFALGAIAAGAGSYLLLSSPSTRVSVTPASLRLDLRF